MADTPSDTMNDTAQAAQDAGKYTKDLINAINGMRGPLQQMSDLMAAIAADAKSHLDSTKEAAAAMKDNTNEMREQERLNMSDLEHKRAQQEASRELAQKRLEKADLQNKMLNIELRTKEVWIEQQEHARRNKEIQEATLGIVERIKKEAKEYNEMLAVGEKIWDAQQRRYISTAESDPEKYARNQEKYARNRNIREFMTGFSRPEQTVDWLANGIGNMLPMGGGIGGLLGLLIGGSQKDADELASGNRIAQMFEGSKGGFNPAAAAQFGLSGRNLENIYGIKSDELATITKAFAQVGITSDEATKSVEGFTSRAGDSLTVFALAADKSFEMVTGSMAGLAAAMHESFGMEAEKSITLLANLGTEAQKAGFNAATFLQQTVDVSVGLKMMNANAEATGATMLRLASNMSTRLGPGHEAYAQQYTARGMGSATAAISGMDVGMSAIIGQMYGKSHGFNVSGLDAWYAMQSGSGQSARGGEQLDIVDVLKEMRNVIPGLGRMKRSEQAYAMMQLFHTDLAGAETILDAQKEVTTTGGLSDATRKRMGTALETEKDKINQITLSVNAIKDILAQILTGVVVIAIDILKGLLNGVMFIGSKIMAMTSTGNTKDAYNAMAGELWQNILANAGEAKTQADRITDSAKNAPTEAKNLLKAMHLGDIGPSQDSMKRVFDSYKPKTSEDMVDQAVDTALLSSSPQLFAAKKLVDTTGKFYIDLKATLIENPAGKNYSGGNEGD